MNHTPVPWIVTGSDFIRPSPMAPAVCQCNSYYAEVKENAIFIAQACSCHDKLVEALTLILPLAKGYAAEHRVGSNDRYVAIAEAAVAKVKEEIWEEA